MAYFTVGYRLPHFISAPLFGDREKFGLKFQANDPDWKEWQKLFLEAYYSTQKQSVGEVVNNAGYGIMQYVAMDSKNVLEIGPGDIDHIQHWKGKPTKYVIADVQQSMLNASITKLQSAGIMYDSHLIRKSSHKLPFESETFDIVVSFYSLEHLYPLELYLQEMYRVLKPKGMIVGAIPTEGGLAWGGGRFLTSRRWFLKNTTINLNKIICWEHPNFADTVLMALDKYFQPVKVGYWPLLIPSIDLNLVIQFIYLKL